MKQAQIITYGLDPVMAGRLQGVAHERGLWLREVQNVAACRSLAASAGPAVLVLMLGKDLLEELTFLQLLSQALPDTAVVVVGETDNPALAALAWDLGAHCVLQPPQPIELLPEIVARLLPVEAR
jgi:DNA-binding NarL/FixJ family response regulator